jgi:hypothetical protein
MVSSRLPTTMAENGTLAAGLLKKTEIPEDESDDDPYFA